MIYLDHNSTTPVFAEVAQAIAECQAEAFANPSSQHSAGRRARQVLEDARERISELLGLQSSFGSEDRLIFTSGGTESNNLATLGLAGQQPGRIVISAVEHPSVTGAAESLARGDWTIDRLPVDHHGVVDVDRLHDLLCPDTRLVSVMLGNHETGTLQPVGELARICSQAGIPLHTDATQVVGKLPVNFHELGVAAMTFAAHKFHGPRGIGCLAVRHGVSLQPQLHGGFQQQGMRPGTEPTSLVVGMCQALEIWNSEAQARIERLTALRDRFESALLAALPNIVVHSAAAPRLPHTSNIAFLGLDRQALLIALDLAGIACSTGSACASGSTDASPVLTAMGRGDDELNSSLRFSTGATTTVADIDQAAQRIINVVNGLRDLACQPKIPAPTR